VKAKDVQALLKSALQQMEHNGASARMLKNYRMTGFGAIRRHFEELGVSEFSDEAVDVFIMRSRDDYEHGTMTYWKWTLIHRSAELLKVFSVSGTLDLPPCPKWDVIHHRFRQKPTSEEMADPKNIFSLVWRTKQEMAQSEFAPRTLDNYQRDGFDRILRVHVEQKTQQYSQTLVTEFVEQSRRNCAEGKMDKSAFASLLRASHLLNEFYETGYLHSLKVTKFEVRDDLGCIESLNMRELMERALQTLRVGGASDKVLRNYRTTGFGAIVRYFEKIGHKNYSEEVINETILHARNEYECGRVSCWKWQLMRRGGELLKKLHDDGKFELSPCASWKKKAAPVRRVPMPVDLTDKDNIRTLIYQVTCELKKLGLSQRTVDHYRYSGFSHIEKKHLEHGSTQYSSELVVEFIDQVDNDYKAGNICLKVYQNAYKAADVLQRFYATGVFEQRRLQRRGLRQPCEPFNALLEKFCADVNRTGNIKASTVKQARSPIRSFLFELEDFGFASFENVTRRIVSERITHLARRFSGGLSTMLFGVKMFLRYLYENSVTTDNLSFAIPEMTSPRKPIREGFSKEQIDQLLAAADTSTATGKRDYAIMLLASQTGLRACDITNLKRADIDWSTLEIRIVQMKTGRPLTIPLPIESGNAIAEYLLNDRPKSDEPFVFIRHVPRYCQLKNVSAIMPRYLQKAGIIDDIAPRSGFHSFRRSFGKRLLEAEVPLDMLGEVFGHRHLDSTRPYVAIDEIGLKHCALGLASIEKAGDTV
jgi:site-specific recombinase XerD